jgi:hypothetical protein
MINVKCMAHTMKVKNIGNYSKTLSCFLALMPHTEKDSILQVLPSRPFW